MREEPDAVLAGARAGSGARDRRRRHADEAAGEAERARALADAIRASFAPLTAQLDHEARRRRPATAKLARRYGGTSLAKPRQRRRAPFVREAGGNGPSHAVTGRSESRDAGGAERPPE